MRGIAEADQSREPNDNEDSAERRWSRMVMRFDPFRDIDRLAQQLTGALRSQSTSIPMDAYRRGDTVFVHFDLPGADPSSIDGTVALAEAPAWWTDPLGSVSDDQGQLGERVGQASPGWHVGPQIVEAPAEVLDEGVRGNDDTGGAIALQPSHGSKSGFEAAVVGLQWVVGMGVGVMEGRREQLVDDAGVEAVPVGGDLHGRDPGPVDRSVEEATGCLFVPPWREEDVDDLAELVDGPEQVAPRPAHPHVRLVDVPAITHHVPTCPSRLGELGCEPVHPPVDAHVVDLDASFGQELLHVPVGEAEAQVPPDRQGDDVGREAIPGEGRGGRRSGTKVTSRSHRASLPEDAATRNATVPAGPLPRGAGRLRRLPSVRRGVDLPVPRGRAHRCDTRGFWLKAVRRGTLIGAWNVGLRARQAGDVTGPLASPSQPECLPQGLNGLPDRGLGRPSDLALTRQLVDLLL